MLAREFFKIRISSSGEGSGEGDAAHNIKVKGIASYNPEVIEKWYMEAIKTAEIIISLEEKYLNGTV